MGNTPLTPEEYERQMAEYERQMREYAIQKEMYDRLYGGKQTPGQSPVVQESTMHGQSPGMQGQIPQMQGQPVQGSVVQQSGQVNPTTGTQQVTGNQTGMLHQKTGVKRSLKKIPIKKILPIVFLVLIVIGVVGTLLGGTETPAPESKSSKPVSSSQAPKPSAIDGKQSPVGSDKDKASIDRVPTPGSTETLGNLMELYNELVFPSVLLVPEPEPVVDKTTVNLGGSYVFRPNKNWASRIDGNSITLVHDEGIVAKFIFNKNKKVLKPDQMKSEVFPEFLAGFGIDDPVYDEIFYNTTLSGVSTRVNAKFNDQPLALEVGMVNCNREILTYVIAYYDTSEVFQSEIVESLLNTITWKSSSVTFAR